MMKPVLLAHARRYPLMAPRDAVKLLYQSEFGGGHLIRDEEACLRRLQQEYAATPQNSNIPLLEEIGSGIVRIHLGALDAARLTAAELGQLFLRSAAEHRGSMDTFQEKLGLLRELTREGRMPFSPEELDLYLTAYEKEGFPAVSHSEGYRNAYHPAYRIISKQCMPERFVQQMP